MTIFGTVGVIIMLATAFVIYVVTRPIEYDEDEY